MSTRSLNAYLVLGFILINLSNGLNTGVGPKQKQSLSKNNSLPISPKKCLEYSKLIRSDIGLDLQPAFGKIEQCGISENSTKSGNAEVGEVPHMALIGHARNGDLDYLCGGSLISEKHVLTTGYCGLEIAKNKTAYFVRMGGLHLTNFTQDIQVQFLLVSEVIVHPKYIAGEVYNDLAILQLKKPVVLSWHTRPICLHTGQPLHKLPLVAAGWGNDPQTHTRNELLRRVKLVETPYKVCKVPYDVKRQFGRTVSKGIDNDTMICATHPLGQDSLCHGVGGGPLYIRPPEPNCSYSLVGLVGFGGNCKTIQDIPTVFTRVAPYVPWIEGIVYPMNSTSNSTTVKL